MKNYLMVPKNKLRDSFKIHRKVQDEKSMGKCQVTWIILQISKFT